MNEQTASFLANQLYPDIKNWIATLARKLHVPVKKARSPKFKSISELREALNKGNVAPNQWITLECKPSIFGPFLRNHFISPIIGNHSQLRLGPQIHAENPVMGMLGQVTSHLKPVGIYPSIDDDLYQICLYPSDAQAFGMIGLMPGTDRMIDFLPAVSTSRHLALNSTSCSVRGVVRLVEPKLLTDIGLPIERWEELRQLGDVWFLDLSDDHADVSPISDAVCSEMWGGLYSSGHMEIVEGEMPIATLVDGMAETFRAAGFEPHVSQNQAGRKEIMIFAQGARSLIDTQAPVFSIHMDAELGFSFEENRRVFDQLSKGFLNVIDETASSNSCAIKNLNDLDFSYTDSASAFSVLKSHGADLIADQIGIALRDWHRKRNQDIA